jgi:hypothetical protein
VGEGRGCGEGTKGKERRAPASPLLTDLLYKEDILGRNKRKKGGDHLGIAQYKRNPPPPPSLHLAKNTPKHNHEIHERHGSERVSTSGFAHVREWSVRKGRGGVIEK